MIRRFLLLLLTPCIISCSGTPDPQPSLKKEETDYPVPPFRFTERSGTPIANADLQGKVWIASFVFTRCNGPCPSVSATMAKLQSELPKRDDLKLVTFTIDPERDTLQELNEYAKARGAEPGRWFFVSGPEKEIHEFATKGFKLLAERSKTPKPGEEFDHSSRIAVVDRKGIIRGSFEGMKDNGPAETATIRQLVDKLLKE